MLKISFLSVVLQALIVTQTCCLAALAQGEETKPVFELDCVSFAGRFLANAPKKKKSYPGLAADGTAWSISPDKKHISVSKVLPGEAAEAAGVESGDEIVSVNGYPVSDATPREVLCYFHMYNPKTLIETLEIQKKDGTKKEVKLQLLPLDKCNADEKRALLEIYKRAGY